MSKLKLKRFFLKDAQGRHFRIFGITNPIDKRGEYYIKATFPDMRNLPLLTETNDNDLNVLEKGIAWRGVQEFSFHYRAGVSHYKDASNSYLDQKRFLPTLGSATALHLFRFNVYSLDHFAPQAESKVSSNDIVFERPFDGHARGFEVAIASDRDIQVIAEPEEKAILQKTSLEDESVYLFVTDGFWMRKPSIPSAYAEIFRYDNPTDIFRGT